jgi:hypothetical protein
MGKINFGRVILGGIVAGIVGDILGYLVDGLMLAPQWAAGMKALGRPELSVSKSVAFSIIGLVYGILMVWLYAAIRPRYGPGRQIAVLAGLAIWVSGVLLPNAGLMWGWPLSNKPYRNDDLRRDRRICSSGFGRSSFI